MSENYLQSISERERERLEQQHLAWRDDTLALLQRAHIAQCERVLEVGCGPGLTSLEIAKLISHTARITALDVSEFYLQHLRNRVTEIGLTCVDIIQADITRPSTDLGLHDAAFCRWFLAWVGKDLDAVLANVYRNLRPGGVFAAMEYLTLRSTCLSPPCAALQALIRAWERFYEDCGGSTEIGSELPEKLSKCGFEIVEIQCVGGLSPKGAPLCNWWRRTYVDFRDMFLERGLLSKNDVDMLDSYWSTFDRTDSAFLYSPVLTQIIAKK